MVSIRLSHHRIKHLQRLALAIGVSFAVGAVTGAVVSWRVLRGATETVSAFGPVIAAPALSPTDPEPAHDPAEPRAVERPGEDGGAVPASITGSAANADAVETLRERKLNIPVDGVGRDDLRDTFADARGGRAHEALDIMSPRHTAVRAVEGGRIEKLFTSRAGGLTIYQFDP